MRASQFVTGYVGQAVKVESKFTDYELAVMEGGLSLDKPKSALHQAVTEDSGNSLQTIIQSFVNSPSGQKYKQYDCKTVTRAFVAWAEQNKIPTQVVSLAPPSADFIAKNPRYKGKSGQGDGHIMPIVNGNAIDFTVRQFGVSRPFNNPLVTPTSSLPAVYGKFGYFTDKPEWFLGGKSHWIGALNSIPSEIFNQNFGDELLEHTIAENLTQGRNLSPITKKYVQDHNWKLTTVNPMTLDINGFDDPFNRVIDIDTDHPVNFKDPIIVHANGATIIDGFHRVYQAQLQGLKQIPAYVPIEQRVAEGKDFDRCFDQACKLYDRAVNKNLKPKLVQVADFQGDGTGADARWLKLPQQVWQHYVVIVGDQVLDPTAKQFGDTMPTQYQVSDLDRLWGKQYQIRPRQGVAENFADGRVKGKSSPGRVKRSGASCDGSVSDLRSKAKNASGERAKMYHWCANMKSGRAKTESEILEDLKESLKNWILTESKSMKTKETINEKKVGEITTTDFHITVDSHAFDQLVKRKLSPISVDKILKGLNQIKNDILNVEEGYKFWVWNPDLELSLGMRKSMGNNRLLLATMVGSKPYDGSTPIFQIGTVNEDQLNELMYKGYRCTKDCSGHAAGYKWSDDRDITDPNECPYSNNSFWEGCLAHTDEQE